MQAEIAIFYILSTDTNVLNLVGGSTNFRIYQGRRRQGSALPAISIEADGIEPSDQKPDAVGSGQGVSKLDRENTLVFCYAGDFDSANTLSQAVRAALDKKIAGSYNTVNVQSIQFLSEDYFDEQLDPPEYVYEHRYRTRVIR